jgi:hypothetical protein
MSVSLSLSVCPSIRPSSWNNSAFTGWIFEKVYVWEFFENLPRKLKFLENLAILPGTLHEDQYTFLSYLTEFFLEWKMFQTGVVEQFKMHISMVNKFFPKSSVYEII